MVVGCLAGSPDTKNTASTLPTTMRALIGVERAHTDVAALEVKLKAAHESCLARLNSDPKYMALVADVKQKTDALDEARDTGTTQEKLDAGSSCNLARIQLDTIRKKTIDSDQTIAKVAKDLASARQVEALEIVAETERTKKSNAAAMAAKKIEEDRARDDRAPFITINQINANGSKYVGQYVKMKAFYKSVDRDNIPLIKDVAEGEKQQKEYDRAVIKDNAVRNGGSAVETGSLVIGGDPNNTAYQKALKAREVVQNGPPTGSNLASYWLGIKVEDTEDVSTSNVFGSSELLGSTVAADQEEQRGYHLRNH